MDWRNVSNIYIMHVYRATTISNINKMTLPVLLTDIREKAKQPGINNATKQHVITVAVLSSSNLNVARVLHSFCHAGCLRQSRDVPEGKKDSRASLSTQGDDVHRILQTDASLE